MAATTTLIRGLRCSQALRASAAPRLGGALRAALSTTDKPIFDEELSAAYAQLAENHRHSAGPWSLMKDAVVSHLAARDGPATILDLASGPGEPAVTIAKALPTATVISTDSAEAMVDTASAKAKDLPNLSARLADLQALDEFATDSVDVCTCCYGYMFPDDKAKALAETYRVLKPGGLLVATTWDRLDMVSITKDIMTAVLGEAPPAPPLNPMALAEEGLFQSMVSSAGLTDVVQTTSTYPFEFGADKSFQLTVGTILVRDKLTELDAWETAETAFWANVDKYTTTSADGSMTLPTNTFRLTTAIKK